MIYTMPEVKKIDLKGGYSKVFKSFKISNRNNSVNNVEELLDLKFWDLKMQNGSENDIKLNILKLGPQPERLMEQQGYVLDICEYEITISCGTNDGLINALGTLKQIIKKKDKGFICELAKITDWPSIEYRSLSTTFAWYAGYGRFGFDMQLWSMKEWKQFINICSDYKINQLNMCLYGYWPFKFDEYPESVLKGLRMRVWNPESENWVEVEYMHPNVAEEFLPELIKYGHKLGIKFFAYIGLNSYSGGYSNTYKNKRMKMPPNSKFINDFDSLCLSDPTTINYLKKSMRQIVAQGFDGIDFEESEEAFWYCNCDKCKATFGKNANTPEETLHAANTELLKILYKELKDADPRITIGIRAWRQPPLVRSDELISEMVSSIPDDVVLFWAPGQYVEDTEFEKWVNAFGKDRIRARDTEAMGFAAGLGRLIRPFRFNGLRCEEEPITQYIEEDIRQHRGSVKMGVAGINGYLFEWYGFFMALFAHAYYGWGGNREPDDFYNYALKSVFGDLGKDILYVMKNMFTIHESQLNIFELEFPFAKNKVEERDIPRIQKAIDNFPVLIDKLNKIMAEIEKDSRTAHFKLHFKKWKVSVERCRVIYDMALESLKYVKAASEEDKKVCLMNMYMLNEKEFDIIRNNYFDVNPISETGIKSCMIPYHELKREILNRLYPENTDKQTVYLGVESLGWMWF